MSEEPTDTGEGAPLLAVTAEQARGFAAAYGLPSGILARCSTLFCLELLSYQYAHGINPRVIIEEVLALEGATDRPRGTKRPERFRRDELRGLWKTHFFAARFIPKNVLNALNSGIFNDAIMGALDPAKAPEGETHAEYAARLSSEVSRLVVEGGLADRKRARRLTGEWVIYAPHPTGNHYLSLGMHDETDPVIREKIIRHCVPEFPCLRELLPV
ncbi:hypothetical protein [Methylobacterium brachiatum]|uniref:hypothetical protein n=1 Tax=Methylobacterium brachiatum TaxID=269660 RepID=UPI000EFC7F6C|nr:hypothetical protein [Methylobacterium brachiatum]AYO82673.1 hypothetical protein EBB05_10650 [Methylobacterium brachiatum]